MRGMSLVLLSNSQCTKGAYLHCKVFLVSHLVCARQLVRIFKAFQINFKAGALPVGREGLPMSLSERRLLIASFPWPGLSPPVGFSCICFLLQHRRMNHTKSLETNQILKKKAGATEAGRELHNSQGQCHE